MYAEYASRWVDALRSGEFKQITGALKDDKGHCCLAVLCELVEGLTWEDNERGNIDAVFHENRDNAVLPKSVMYETGLGSVSPATTAGKALVAMNDKEGWGFDQIANEIEKHWEEL